MKNIVLFIILVVLTSCHQKFKENSNGLEVRATCSRFHDTIIGRMQTEIQAYDISLDLVNTSNHIITCWIMSCSWYNNFIINNEYLEILSWDCDSNSQRMYSIKPNKQKNFKFSVFKKTENPVYFNFSNTKFGFIYIDFDTLKYSDCLSRWREYDTIVHDKSLQRVIWSNSINLKLMTVLRPTNR